MNEKPIVFYNEEHIEGQIARWLVIRMLKDQAELIGLHRGIRQIPDVSGRDVLFFGVCFNREKMLELQKQAHTFEVYESDLKARETVAGIKNAHFDLKKTPARFAYGHFKKAFEVEAGGRKWTYSGNTWLIDFSIDALRHGWPKIDRPMLSYGVFDILESIKDPLAAFDLLATMDPVQVADHGKEAIAKDRIKQQQKKEQETNDKPQAAENKPGDHPSDPKTPRARKRRKSKISPDAPLPQ